MAVNGPQKRKPLIPRIREAIALPLCSDFAEIGTTGCWYDGGGGGGGA